MSKLEEVIARKELENKELILTTRSNEIELTSDQKTALLKVADFIEDQSSNFFLLAGYSGTGKTTIAENIVGYISNVKKKNVKLLAPTNAAKNRIAEKIKMPYTSANTIHKELYSIDEDGNFRPNGSFNQEFYIIDECSMIDRDILNQIIIKSLYNKNPFKIKIIFMGDVYQLEPIGENPKIFDWEKISLNVLYSDKTDTNLKIPIFFDRNKHELTEVKRYDGALLKVATDMRTYKKPWYNEIETERLSQVYTFSNLLPKLIKRGNNDFAIITSTNQKRIFYNNEVRNFKFRDAKVNLKFPQNKETFVSINNNAHYSNGDILRPLNIHLIEEFEIKLMVNEYNVKYLNEEPVFEELTCMLYCDKIFNFQEMKDKSKHILFFPDIEKSSLHGNVICKSWMKGYFNISHNVKKIIFDTFKNKITKEETTVFKKDIIIATYGYAISGHKAQGQEWDYVFIDGTYLSTNWDAGKWYYTTITRGRKKVEVKKNRYLTVIPKNALIEQ